MDPAVRIDIQEAISRFYTGRIGVRFLIEHHVSTLPPVRILRTRVRVHGSMGGKTVKVGFLVPRLHM